MSARRNGNRARCQHEGCEKFAQTRGLCKAHGGGSRCRDPSCNKLAQSRGLCIAHGGGRRCQHQGCSKLAQSKGFCISHGGGRRCTVPNCEKFSQVKGRCKSHSKLAENSDDGEETEAEQLSDRTMASPPSMDQARGHYHLRSPPSPMHSTDAAPQQRVSYLANPLARLRSQESLPLPPARSFGLSSGMPMQQSLSLPRPALYGIGNRENVQTQHHDGYDHDMEADAVHRGHHHGTIDAFKRVPSINPRFQEDEELRPLPYSYPLPSTRQMLDRMEEKREAEAQHQSYLLLPPRFLQSATTSMPSIGHNVMSAASAHTNDHFSSHGRHHAPAIEPTSIPLLSFLDRNKDSTAAPSSHAMRAPSWTSSNTMAAVPTERSNSTSPPLPSIVLPSLTRHNQNQNLR